MLAGEIPNNGWSTSHVIADLFQFLLNFQTIRILVSSDLVSKEIDSPDSKMVSYKILSESQNMAYFLSTLRTANFKDARLSKGSWNSLISSPTRQIKVQLHSKKAMFWRLLIFKKLFYHIYLPKITNISNKSKINFTILYIFVLKLAIIKHYSSLDSS